MKLMYFSEQTLPKQMGGGSKLPRIAFNKSGLVTFNEPARQLAGLKDKDKITLAQDPDAPENWYFFKDPHHGFELRTGYKGKNLLFNHITLVQAFLAAIDKEFGKTYNLKIAGQPTVLKEDKAKTRYWGILI